MPRNDPTEKSASALTARWATLREANSALRNRDAAEMLGVSVKALESLLVRSRRALKDKLGQERQS